MSLHVAVSDPLPVYRLGLVTALREIGVIPEAPEDLIEWVARTERRLLLITLSTRSDWERLDQVARQAPAVLVVAVLPDADTAGHLRALAAGAAAVVGRDADPQELRDVVAALAAGRSVLPLDVIRALAGRPADDRTPSDAASAEEIGWLRDLARGRPVAQLARDAGYSERMMFRLLSNLYERVGGRNRTETLILARDRGWI